MKDAEFGAFRDGVPEQTPMSATRWFRSRSAIRLGSRRWPIWPVTSMIGRCQAQRELDAIFPCGR